MNEYNFLDNIESTVDAIIPVLRSDHWDVVEKKEWLVFNHFENMRKDEINLLLKYLGFDWYFNLPEIKKEIFSADTEGWEVITDTKSVFRARRVSSRYRILIEKGYAAWGVSWIKGSQVIFKISFENAHDRMIIRTTSSDVGLLDFTQIEREYNVVGWYMATPRLAVITGTFCPTDMVRACNNWIEQWI